MITVKDIEECLKNSSGPSMPLTRIYPDGKEHPDIPGLYYASDKFWEEYDIYFRKAIKNLTS
jgi:hypothetical protein